MHIMLYDYRTGKMKEIFQDTSRFTFADLAVESDRYLVSGDHSESERSVHLVYDLVTGKKMTVVSPGWSEVHISADGRRLLQTTKVKVEGNHDVYNNIVVDVASVQTGTIYVDRLPNQKEFNGKVVTFSGDLGKVVVDKANGDSRSSGLKYWFAPDLAVVSTNGKKAKSVNLPGWNAVRDRILKLADKKVFLPSCDSLIAEMNADGSQLALTLDFEETVPGRLGQFTSDRQFDWNRIGLWEINKGTMPTYMTSRLLDTQGDQGPGANRFSEHSSLWRRLLKTRLTPNGLVVVRATVEDLNSGASDIHIKTATLGPNRVPSRINECTTGPMQLNPGGTPDEVRGISDLQVGPSGSKVIFNTYGDSTRVLDLGDGKQD